MKKKSITITLIAILVLFSGIAIYLFIPVNRSSDIQKYLKNKYNLSKEQYTLLSIEKSNIAVSYNCQDKDGNRFEINDYGTTLNTNFIDNYQQKFLMKDINEIAKRYFGSNFVYANNDYNLFGGIDQEMYDIKTFEFRLNGSIRIWVKSNDENKEEILNLIKSDIDLIHEALRSGIKIYQIKETAADQAYGDFERYNDNIENRNDFSKNYYYAVSNYKNEIYDNRYVQDAATGNHYYFSGELLK